MSRRRQSNTKSAGLSRLNLNGAGIDVGATSHFVAVPADRSEPPVREFEAHHIQHMQKALTQMNVKLHHVISDITGKTGLDIIEAIVGGERDPRKLARLRDPRIKADEATIAKSLQGHWREEHILELTQALELYRFYQDKIAECDREIEAGWSALRTAAMVILRRRGPAGDAAKETPRASTFGRTCTV